MGSMFIVTVPVRDHEVHLRKKEMHIYSIQHVEGTGRDSRLSSLDGASQSNDSGSISSPRASIVSEDYDVYSGIAHGKNARVLLGSDEMTVVRVEDDSTGPFLDDSDKKKSKSEEEHAIKTMIQSIFLEKHLEDCLKKFEIMSATWGQSVDGMYIQVAFTKGAEKSEAIINHLLTCGIGQKYNSSLCVCAASVYHENDKNKDNDDDDADDENGLGSGSSSEAKAARTTKWNDFVASIKSRLTVAQVVQGVKANAIMTFDYIVLIIVAGMIAGLGLVDDSSVNVVASMLVSPLMGPIMATTFGAVIRDYQLIKTGLVSELVGLLLCLIVGLIFGSCLEMYKGPWLNVDKWPTDQMRGRSEYKSLQVGVLVAVPSGCGVALSILAGNSGSLVGVAISASLLPPAVNCGILWGLAAVIAIKEKMAGRTPLLPCDTFLGGGNPFIDPSKAKTYYYTDTYKILYCKNAAKEFAIMGIISFALTWLNIVLIFSVGVIILKIKEVAPHTTRKSLSRFWKEDLKVAREFNQQGGTMKGLVQELNETGDKEGILRRLEDDRVFNAVNRKAVLAPVANMLDDVQMNSESKPKPSRSDKSMGNNPAAGQSGWGGWLGGIFGSKDKQEPDNSLPGSPEEPAPASPSSAGKKKPKLV